MSYNPNIPNPNDLLSDSQGDILQNFQALNTVYGTNHYPYDNATVGQIGKHKFVSMPVLAAAPATIAGEGALYFKTSGAGSALFMVRDGNAGTEVQLTSSSVGNVQTAANGWTWLPGRLLLQWGSFNPNVSTVVNFPVPFTTVPYNVQLTVSASNNSTFRACVSTGSLTVNGFTFEGTISAAANPVYYMAIGLRV